jgi:hypothetical protein
MINIGGKKWELPGPPLDIGLTGVPFRARLEKSVKSTDVRTYWSRSDWRIDPPGSSYTRINSSDGEHTTLIYNNTAVEESFILKTGKCIADDAYSWGFSSLLLLTFCVCSFLFWATLIGLQDNTFRYSRSDRTHQSYSLYTDILYLADELKEFFGPEVCRHSRSPEELDKKIARYKGGLRINTSELPKSRVQEFVEPYMTVLRQSREAEMQASQSLSSTALRSTSMKSCNYMIFLSLNAKAAAAELAIGYLAGSQTCRAQVALNLHIVRPGQSDS